VLPYVRETDAEVDGVIDTLVVPSTLGEDDVLGSSVNEFEDVPT
jgi:hypothetical protein